MGGTLLWLNDAYSTTTDRPEDLPTVKADVSKLTATEVGKDGKTYKVWWVVNPQKGVLPGKYLVDETGQARWLLDPGIGGRLNYSNSGASLKKFNPPQPRLFATIIDGIMAGNLPWGLVILGAVLAVVMQLAGVSALAFAVGVYLPLSTTLPIFVGGLIRAVADRLRKFTPEESETSAGHDDVHRTDRRRLAGRHHHRPSWWSSNVWAKLLIFPSKRPAASRNSCFRPSAPLACLQPRFCLLLSSASDRWPRRRRTRASGRKRK